MKKLFILYFMFIKRVCNAILINSNYPLLFRILFALNLLVFMTLDICLLVISLGSVLVLKITEFFEPLVLEICPPSNFLIFGLFGFLLAHSFVSIASIMLIIIISALSTKNLPTKNEAPNDQTDEN